jgi:hypothetical protein
MKTTTNGAAKQNNKKQQLDQQPDGKRGQKVGGRGKCEGKFPLKTGEEEKKGRNRKIKLPNSRRG